ncbi:hypothetical protein LSH36_703g00004, partial [Paralvinella palmiformis]
MTMVDSWLEHVIGIPEVRIKDQSKLIRDIKQRISSIDVEVKTETAKFVIGDDHIKLGEIVEQELKSPVVAGSINLFEGPMTEVVHSLGLSMFYLGSSY